MQSGLLRHRGCETGLGLGHCLGQGDVIGRIADTLLRDDARQILARRDIEGRVVDLDALWRDDRSKHLRHLKAAVVGEQHGGARGQRLSRGTHLLSASFLDLDLIASCDIQINRAARKG